MKIKGFTPVFDNLVVKYKGIATALVYGKIWRYCEWSDLSVCTASNNRLAEELGIGESTVRRAKDVLEKDGFIRKTGRDGTTDTVTVLHNLVLELYGPGDSPANDEQPSANGERATPLMVSDKDSSNKIEEEDIVLAAAYGLGNFSNFSEYPAVQEKLDMFMSHFPHLEIKNKSMEKNFVKQAEENLSGFSLDEINRMCLYCKGEDGWDVVQPRSIVNAYNKMKQSTEEDILCNPL